MRLNDLLKGLEKIVLKTKGDINTEITSLEYDSREVKPGSLFVAIRGYQTDGHQYIKEAITKGAVGILVMEEGLWNVPSILVQDTREALALLSKNFYGNPANELKIIGITGTNGKTSITYMLQSILEKAGFKVGIIGTIKNEIAGEALESTVTTPESKDLQRLLREMVTKGCAYCLMEVSSHALFLKRVEGILFEVGVFTNLTQDHLDFHESMEEYGRVKQGLFSQIKATGLALVNGDDKYHDKMLEKCSAKRKLTYGIINGKDFLAQKIQMTPFGTSFMVKRRESTLLIESSLVGAFNVSNMLAAVGVALELGIDVEIIKSGLRDIQVPGRFELIVEGQDFGIAIDYAHTPDGLLSVLKTARSITKGRVISVFGCGGDRDRGKRPIMGQVAGSESDYVILTSDNPRTEDPLIILDEIEKGLKKTTAIYEKIEDRKNALKRAISIARKDDLILVAGKGHEDYQIIGKKKIHFSDQEIVKGILKEDERDFRRD